MSTAWYQARITKTQEQIVAYETTIDALILNPTKNYSLDTGQSKQTVGKQDLKSLQESLDRLYARLDSLNAKCNGGSVIALPRW